MIIREKTKEKILTSMDVYNVIHAILNTEDEISREREHFYVIGLNAKNMIQYIELCHLGTLTNSIVHPREVFRIAVLKGVASIIIAHNHPSGDSTPSRDDKVITERLENAGEILGIKVLDHVIIAGKTHKSMRDSE